MTTYDNNDSGEGGETETAGQLGRVEFSSFLTE